MGRQYRSLNASGGATLFTHNSTAGGGGPLGSSGKRITVPNYGVSVFYGTTPGTWVLDPPAPGMFKTLLVGATVSTATVIMGSSDGAATVTFNSSSAGSKTRLTFEATVDKCVRIVGINSTEWRIVSVHPTNLAVNATGVLLGTS